MIQYEPQEQKKENTLRTSEGCLILEKSLITRAWRRMACVSVHVYAGGHERVDSIWDCAEKYMRCPFVAKCVWKHGEETGNIFWTRSWIATRWRTSSNFVSKDAPWISDSTYISTFMRILWKECEPKIKIEAKRSHIVIRANKLWRRRQNNSLCKHWSPSSI